MKRASVLLGVCLFAARTTAEETKSLADCIAIALQHHPSLQSGAARVRAARERGRQAAASYLPQIDATYAANRRNTSVAARTGTALGTATQPFNFFNAGVSFTQLLFDFGQTLHALRAVQASAKASSAELEAQCNGVIFGVKQAYDALLAAQQLRAVAREAVRQRETHLELATGRYDVGLAPKVNVTHERARLASKQLDLVRAENNTRLGQETLRNALGIDEPVHFALQQIPTVLLSGADEDVLVHQAREARPELHSIRAQACNHAEQVAVLERNHLPGATGGGQNQWSGPDFPLQPNWNTGASITLPLFRGGLTAAQVREARENLAALEAEEERLRQSVALEVRKALLRVREPAAGIRVSREGLEHARENLNLAENRYATGVGSIIEVVDAHATFMSARGQAVQTLYEHHTGLAALEQAVGAALQAQTVENPGLE